MAIGDRLRRLELLAQPEFDRDLFRELVQVARRGENVPDCPEGELARSAAAFCALIDARTQCDGDDADD